MPEHRAVPARRGLLSAALALALVVATAPTASAAESVVADVEGDVFDYRSEERGAFPPGDLVAFTVDLNAAQLRLGFELLEPGPVDATVQDDWLGATSLVAGIDLDGDGGDDRQVQTYWDGAAVTRVVAGDQVVCETTPGFAGRVVTVVVDAACIGDPASIAVQATAFWDVDADGAPTPPDHVDTAPDQTTVTVTRSEPRPVDRIAGSDRVGTSVALAQEQFPNGADSVYLASAGVPADAVSAGSLVDGPVLLVGGCGALPNALDDEIDRLDPARVVALGGRAAVCEEVLDAAAGDDRTATRLAGEDRFATALAISGERYDDADDDVASVYLARADDAADSVAAGGLDDGPVLLVPTCGALPDAVADEVERLAPDRVVALGSPDAVCDQLLDGAAGGATTARLGGASRFATAAAIALDPASAPADTVYLADAFGLADAVAAGSLTGGPVLLAPQCGPVPDEVRRTIDQLDPARVVALGGSVALCDDALLDAAA